MNDFELSIKDIDRLIIGYQEEKQLATTAIQNIEQRIKVLQTKRSRLPGGDRPVKSNASKYQVAAKKAKEKLTKEPQIKSARTNGYRLSAYDNLVFAVLKETGRAMINAEIVAAIIDKNKLNGGDTDQEVVRKMVVRSLQKLANRRNDISKAPYNGRGMSYALPEWMNGKTIKKKYAHKETANA